MEMQPVQEIPGNEGLVLVRALPLTLALRSSPSATTGACSTGDSPVGPWHGWDQAGQGVPWARTAGGPGQGWGQPRLPPSTFAPSTLYHGTCSSAPCFSPSCTSASCTSALLPCSPCTLHSCISPYVHSAPLHRTPTVRPCIPISRPVPALGEVWASAGAVVT